MFFTFDFMDEWGDGTAFNPPILQRRQSTDFSFNALLGISADVDEPLPQNIIIPLNNCLKNNESEIITISDEDNFKINSFEIMDNTFEILSIYQQEEDFLDCLSIDLNIVDQLIQQWSDSGQLIDFDNIGNNEAFGITEIMNISEENYDLADKQKPDFSVFRQYLNEFCQSLSEEEYLDDIIRTEKKQPEQADCITEDVGVKNNFSPRNQPLLWKMLLELLNNKNSNPSLIKWISFKEGSFKIINEKEVAKLWGQRKNKKNMNYAKMSRSLRHYYTSNILVRNKNKERKMMYRFSPEFMQFIKHYSI